MNRRNFLFGTIGAAAGGLLLRAQGEDVKLFEPTLEETVAISRVRQVPQIIDEPRRLVMVGETLFNGSGQPVCVVDDISVKREFCDVSSWEDSFTAGIGGRISVRLEADVLPMGLVNSWTPSFPTAS